jgi:hypothetical protein
MLVDVAGEEESGMSAADGRRDSTACTMVEVALVEGFHAPVYRVAWRKLWTGVKLSALYAELRDLAALWRVRYLVVDSTGVGAGLASFLSAALPVLPFVFSQASKSDLGWGWLAIIDGGRWKEPASGDSCQSLFYQQLAYCQYEILPGPGKVMRWSVPDGTRDVTTGELVHDDLVMSAALSVVLDDQNWSSAGPAAVVRGKDPLRDMDKGF